MKTRQNYKIGDCLELMREYSDNHFDLILDPFMGSGTILESCRNTNRNCLGFEISDEWEHHYNERSMKNTQQLETWF